MEKPFYKQPYKKTADIFISNKERIYYEFEIKQSHDGMLTTPGDLFKQSDLTKIEFFLANDVLQSLQYNSNKHFGVSLFKSYLVREIKGKATDEPYKKFHLIVQGYINLKKRLF